MKTFIINVFEPEDGPMNGAVDITCKDTGLVFSDTGLHYGLQCQYDEGHIGHYRIQEQCAKIVEAIKKVAEA